LDKPKVFFKTDSAIMDFVFIKHGENPLKVLIGQDSGHIT